MKRSLWCVLLIAALTLLSLSPTLAESPAPETAIAIHADETLTAQISSPGGWVYYSFVPETGAEYRFYSTGNYDTYGYLYDADMQELYRDDDDGDGSNFLIECTLEAGATYYFGVRFYSSDVTGSFPVALEALDLVVASETYNDVSLTPAEAAGGAALRVDASASSNITYAWLRAPLDGDEDDFAPCGYTGPELVLDAVTADNVGRYRCDIATKAQSAQVYFDVSVLTGLHIEAPEETEFTVARGGSLQLAVEVGIDDGVGYTCQWYRQRYDPDTLSWKAEAPIEGATGTAWLESDIREAEMLAFEVVDDYGNVRRTAFRIAVENGLEVARVGELQRTVPWLSTAELQVNATAQDADGLTYLWYGGYYYFYDEDDYEYDIDESEPIEGATGSTLAIPVASSSRAYRCVVRDRYFNRASVDFLINVDNDSPDLSGAIPLTLGEEGVAENVGAGEIAWFSFRPDEYEAYDFFTLGRNSVPLAMRWVEGSSNVLTEYFEPDPEHPGAMRDLDPDYTCYFAARLNSGEPSGSIRMMVTHALSLTAHADGNTVIDAATGDPIKLGVTVGSSHGEPEFRWFRYDTDGAISPIDGATGNSFAIESAAQADAATYECRVEDALEAVSVRFTVNVGGASGRIVLPLTLDEAAEARISVPGEIAYFSFTPAETGEYDFYSLSDSDTYGYVYDSRMSKLNTDDDSGDSLNFMVTHRLTAGKTYYFGASYLTDDEVGSFPVKLSRGATLDVTRVGPYEVKVPLNGSAALAVNAVSSLGDEAISYRWYAEIYDALQDITHHVELDSFTGNACTVDPVTLDSVGDYYCIVTAGRKSETVSFSVAVDTGFSARALGRSDIFVAPHGSAELAVEANVDIGDVHVCWERYSEDEYEYVDIPGATDFTFRAEDVTAPERYRCRVYDDFGNSKYFHFDVYVDTQLYVEDGMTYSVKPNEPLTLKVRTHCNDGIELTYRWEVAYDSVDPDGNSEWKEETIEGATGGTLSLESVPRTAEYTCYVSDGYGNEFSPCFYVYVDNGFEAGAVKDQIAAAYGEPATLEVVAGCDAGELSYHWSVLEEYDDDDYEYLPLPGETSGQYTTPGIVQRAEYRCDVYDEYGNRESLYFDVYVDSGLALRPVGSTSLKVEPGEEVALEVEVAPEEGVQLQWSRYTLVSSDWYDYYTWTDVPGATGSRYAVPSVTQDERYRCTATDAYANRESVQFDVDIDSGFAVRTSSNTYLEVAKGETANLFVDAETRLGSLHYDWWYYGDEESKQTIAGDTASIETEPITRSITYTCHVTDDYGHSKYRYFYIEIANDLRAEPLNGVDLFTIEPGNSVDLAVVASGGEGEIQYEWYRYYNDGGERSMHLYTPGITTPVLDERAAFACHVYTGDSDGVYIRFDIRIKSDFSAKRVSELIRTVAPGEPVTLAVQATGDVTYSWRSMYRSSVIPGATAAQLTLPSITENTRFYCRVEDQYRNSAEIQFLRLLEGREVALDEITDFRYDEMMPFTPPVTGSYRFRLYGNYPESDISLYDSNLNEIDWFYAEGTSDPFELVAGQRYFFMFFSEGNSVQAKLERVISSREKDLVLRSGQVVDLPGSDTPIASDDTTIASVKGRAITAKKAGSTRVTVGSGGSVTIYNVTVLSQSALKLPQALTELAADAFSGTDAAFVELNDRLVRLESGAFAGARLLQLVVPSATTELSDQAFPGRPTIVCPEGSAAQAYAQSHGLTFVYLHE